MSDCSCEQQDGYANCCRAKSLETMIETRNLWVENIKAKLSAAEKERDDLKATLAEMHKQLNERNEATKVWIQSDTQCRRYACQLERELEALKAIGGE